VHAAPLPEGGAPVHWWIAEGRVTRTPVPGARDLPGGWLLPGGLVDAHMHLTMNFGRVMPHADGSDALMAANGRAQRAAGVLALRDAGCAWGGVPSESAAGPRLQRAGSLMAPPGRGYPGVCRPVPEHALVAAALEEVAAGAAWVKLLGDFPGADGNWFAAPSTYSRDVLTKVVREVHAAGARVMGHSTGLGAADLVAAGVDSVEHGMALTPDLVAQMADRGLAWTCTLATAVKHVGALAEAPTPVGAYLRAQLDRVRELLPLAAARGVPLLAGTDEIPMGALALKLQRMTEYGLTPTQALAAGSTAARAWLGFPLVAPDGPADLVTFAVDPRVDLDELTRPAAVLFAGRLVV
jgi:imidazolonepropionase-like amidohydrolase